MSLAVAHQAGASHPLILPDMTHTISHMTIRQYIRDRREATRGDPPLLRLDKLSYDAHMIAERLPQRGMFDVKTPRSVGVGGAAH